MQVVVFSGPKMLDSVEEIKKDSNAYPVVTGPLARDETFAVFATTENDLRQRQVQVLHYWISTYSPFDPPIEPKVEDIMEEIPLILPEYEHLKKNVTDFVGDFAFHQSIFVMMKWEDKDMAARKKEILTDIFAGVSEAASPFGLTARRADRKTYHTQLWDNLCTYMIGCKYGIAILEDKVLPELNPNVTLELGFMRALGRHVLLFVEENFKHNRIDLLDTIPKKFTIDKKGKVNKESIRSEVQNWLQVDLKLTKKTY